MGYQRSVVPDRLPAGTKFVIEGRAGRIRLRYLEFPDGQRLMLPVGHAGRGAVAAARRRRDPQKRGPVQPSKRSPKKISSSAGTASRLAR
jgi:hypothetical protein